MAFHDWNHDGEKDWKDNAIEYQLLKNMNKDEKPSYTPPKQQRYVRMRCGYCYNSINNCICCNYRFYFRRRCKRCPRLVSHCDIYYCGFGYKRVVRLKVKGR